MNDAESFWEGKRYLIVTDRSKPAIKLTIDELKKRGMSVQVLDIKDLGGSQVQAALEALSLPVEKVVIGITAMEPADIIQYLLGKGCKDIWVHWRTDTEKVREMSSGAAGHILTGRCPMLYLGNGSSIHGVHRLIARSFGKY
ncbi:MAG: hypothetical protein A4E24_02045 [Methanomethylovorans sp. PtaU1.Bin093]|uniref:hypothetical protein n=1 Tax=Methanomethylovorans sp. PtaU1.Bin093 TaxID=1811679 RepID=UPI0009CEA7E7|nr:hypothetical protein [Methanomethylovorans sp. PtaU1.Bin093]OPY18017.1 MAG: hypothetical protein A4E24_02045 [Methanomethylovorans sp. PtaU1.Bin093]